MLRFTHRVLTLVKKTADVSQKEWDYVMSLAPQGCDLVRTRRYDFWRDFYFKVNRKPSRESGLKFGDTFVTSAVCK